MKLEYHRRLIPNVLPLLRTHKDDVNAADVIKGLYESVVFDCRSLPIEFVEDTGGAVIDEINEGHADFSILAQLPFPSLYMEFSDGIAAHGCTYTHVLLGDMGEGGISFEEARRISVGFQNGTMSEDDFKSYGMTRLVVWDDMSNPEKCRDQFTDAELMVSVDDPEMPKDKFVIRKRDQFRPPAWRSKFETFEEAVKHWDTRGAEDGGDDDDDIPEDVGNRLMVGLARFIGTLTLMNEKFVASQFFPDPAPNLTKARMKRGRLPTDGARFVITVNVAAVRRVARPAQGTHESPCLHWRRGHPRVLHRGSEFESKIWIPRCLVGDPARGYISKDYRLVHREGLIAPAKNSAVHGIAENRRA